MPAFTTAPWSFFDDLETSIINVLEAGELEIPQPGAQVLDYIEEQAITFFPHPETVMSRRETKGNLPRCYIWADSWKLTRRGDVLYSMLVHVRMHFYASVSTSLEEGHRKARAFSLAVASLFDQLSLRVYDDVPINPTPLLDDWRAYANGMPADVVSSEVDVREEDASGIIGRARLGIEFVHDF